MTIAKKIFAWIVFSSRDASKISLTLKSAFAALITGATIVAGLSNVNLPSETLTQLADATISLVQTVLLAVSTVGTIVGLVRKIRASMKGENAATAEVKPTPEY